MADKTFNPKYPDYTPTFRESVDIFEDTDTGTSPYLQITKSEDFIRKEKEAERKKSEKQIINNVGKVVTEVGDLAAMELSVGSAMGVWVVNQFSGVFNGPEIPSPLDVNEAIRGLAKMEYEGAAPAAWKTGALAIGTLGTGLMMDNVLSKIQKAKPKLYRGLVKAFPYVVGQLHNQTTTFVRGVAGMGQTGGKLKNAAVATKNFAKAMVPTVATMKQLGSNWSKLAKVGTGIGMMSMLMGTKDRGPKAFIHDDGYVQIEGDISLTEALDKLAETLLGDENLSKKEYSYEEKKEMGAEDFWYNEDKTLTVGEGVLKAYLWPDQNEEYFHQFMRAQNEKERWGKTEEELSAMADTQWKDAKKRKQVHQDLSNGFSMWERFLHGTRAGENIKKVREGTGITGNAIRSFLNNPDAIEENNTYDLTEHNLEAQAEDQADLAVNEQYIAEKNKIGQLPFDMYDKKHYPIAGATDAPGSFGLSSIEFGEVPTLGYGGDPNEAGMFSESIDMPGMAGEDDIKIKEIINQPGFENMSEFDIFEEAKKDGYEEVQVAMADNLLGKVPIWAAANVDKFKMLLQRFSKNEKKNMDNVKNKIGTEDQVNAMEELDILDMPSGGVNVGPVKNKKTIIDSPEANEAVFYSGIEAKLMDPNTPDGFKDGDSFFKFLQAKGISKAEVDDNILNRYIEITTKNGAPLRTKEMLKIVRQAPMRKIESVTYGDARYGGEKRAIYSGGNMERGEIPGSYREEVLFLDPKYIPNDPDQLPGASHDFTERYVVGWSRLTDRKATLPVDKTKAGITGAIDEKQIKTIKKNQKKLASQIDGLYASAYEKLKRAGDIEDLPDIDNLTSREIKDKVNQFTFDLEALDAPLYKQIEQFENKLMTDNMKLDKFKQMKEGQKVIVTFADELQSDILQQAKLLETDLRKQLGDLLDLPLDKRMKALGEQVIRYSGSARNVSPEVLKFYTKNETIFRPMFQTAEDMQEFVVKFNTNKQVFDEIAQAGPAPSDDLIKRMNEAIKVETQMLEELEVALSEGAMKQLFPNVPFKDRAGWGSALVKRDLAKAAKLLYRDKIPDAAEWYVVTPSKLVTKRYGQSGGTNTPLAERTKNMKGIGMEEFYGGPDSLSTSIDKSGTAATNPNFGKPKHYTSELEKILRTLAKENNSEFKILNVDRIGDAYGIKITPEMLLPHKTHRKDGGMVYTPELIDIFEAA
tara:strand:- start:3014 stop:6622 length:3609 start_codon:yes stop_codon:yes gene_type:complete